MCKCRMTCWGDKHRKLCRRCCTSACSSRLSRLSIFAIKSATSLPDPEPARRLSYDSFCARAGRSVRGRGLLNASARLFVFQTKSTSDSAARLHESKATRRGTGWPLLKTVTDFHNMRLNCITRVLGPHPMSIVGKISFMHSILGTHTLHGVFMVLALSIVSYRRASALSHVEVRQTVTTASASNEARASSQHCPSCAHGCGRGIRLVWTDK